MVEFLRPTYTPFLPRAGDRRTLSRPPIDPRGHIREPPANPPVSGTVKLMALIWATWNQAAPGDLTQLASSPSLKGNNFAIWENALRARILARAGDPDVEIVQDATSWSVNGEACIDLASMFDLVVLGHWWPKSMVDLVKARSTAPGGTKVLLWDDFESRNQKQPFAALTQPGWAEAKDFPISSDGNQLNVYGCRTIDKFETSDPSPGKVACNHSPLESGLPSEATLQTAHSWDIDVYTLTDNGQEDGQTVEFYIFNAYVDALSFGTGYYDLGSGQYVIDGFVWDNLLEFPFKGSASNDYRPGWTADYQAGWRAFVRTFRNFTNQGGAFPDDPFITWGNGPLGVGVYSRADIRNRYVEHFFRTGTTAKTWNDIATDIATAKANQLYIVIAGNGTVGQTNVWATSDGGPNPATNGTWAQLVGQIHAVDAIESTFIAACQQLAQGHTFWQVGFRTPS